LNSFPDGHWLIQVCFLDGLRSNSWQDMPELEKTTSDGWRTDLKFMARQP